MLKTMYTLHRISLMPIRIMTITGALGLLLTLPLAAYFLYVYISGPPAGMDERDARPHRVLRLTVPDDVW